MTDSILYLIPTYFQESIFPAITRPKIPALILTLFLFRHMHRYKYIIPLTDIAICLAVYFEKKICLCVCLSMYLSVYLYICLSVYLSVSPLFSGD